MRTKDPGFDLLPGASCSGVTTLFTQPSCCSSTAKHTVIFILLSVPATCWYDHAHARRARIGEREQCVFTAQYFFSQCKTVTNKLCRKMKYSNCTKAVSGTQRKLNNKGLVAQGSVSSLSSVCPVYGAKRTMCASSFMLTAPADAAPAVSVLFLAPFSLSQHSSCFCSHSTVHGLMT